MNHQRIPWSWHRRATTAAVLGLAVLRSQAASYYVDSAGGDDANLGTSQGAPWKSLAKVNGKTFQPGDTILFKCGEVWTGQLNPKGSGAVGSPIVIDQYGSGAKPVIDANGASGNGAVYLFNQEYWEINNLEIRNDAADGGDRRGVYLSASNFVGNVVHHLYVRNCDIHNIKGIVDQTSSAAKRTGGVIVEVIDDTPTPTRLNDILIENCTIRTVDNQGIALNNRNSVSDYPGTPEWEARKFTQVVIRGNRISDVAKNAMIIRLTDETGLIEHNVCWDTAYRAYTGNTIFSRSCRGTVFQFNEGYRNRAGELDPRKYWDGSLYDADLQSPGCIFQYSYSHDNAQGLFWQCTDARDANVIVRYNISQNDRGRIFCMSYENTSTFIYNNIVFVPAHLSPTIIDDRQVNAKTYSFFNNIIYNLSPTASYQWKTGAGRTFDYNVFYGQHPAGEPDDPHKLIANPMLVSPGSGSLGLDTVSGYQLQAGSPCRDSGLLVPGDGGRDYWGNTVPFNAATDRGAHEWNGSITNRLPMTNSVPATNRATIRDGASADVDLDEQALGYVMVKYHTNGLAAKGYFGFDLSGLNPDLSAPAIFQVTSAANSGAQRVRLWALDQPYPSMSDDLTWNTAQANELAGNGLLADGLFTATPICEAALPGGVSSHGLPISPPWGKFVTSNKLVLVLTGVDDPNNSSSGFRVVVTNAIQLPALIFSSVPPPLSPPQLTGCVLLPGGGFEFTFSSQPGLSFTVLCTTDLALPRADWSVLGLATEESPGHYRFADTQTTAETRRFYQVRAS